MSFITVLLIGFAILFIGLCAALVLSMFLSVLRRK